VTAAEAALASAVQLPPEGLAYGVPAEAYHQKHLGMISKSALDVLARSPAHYRAWLEGEGMKETPALTFGKAFHCCILEPQVFAATYSVLPDFGDCRVKANKEAKQAWFAANDGRTFISEDMLATIRGMEAAVRKHPAASRILLDGESEVTIRWTDESTGLPCKSRADYYVRDKRLVADLKSTEDASPEAFMRSVAKYRYHVQDALYRDGFRACGEAIDHFALVAVEKEPPFGVAVYTLDADAVAKGYSLARSNIELMSACLCNDSWPAYSNGVETLSLPRWAA
jgi:hypothetical protein